MVHACRTFFLLSLCCKGTSQVSIVEVLVRKLLQDVVCPGRFALLPLAVSGGTRSSLGSPEILALQIASSTVEQ